MEFKEALEKLRSNDEFLNWKKENKDSYLCHGFIMQGIDKWQIGYYHPKRDTITAFTINEDSIDILKEEEVFKDGGTVLELTIDQINIKKEQAEKIAAEFLAEKYNNESLIKKIIIIQKLADFGIIWNLTLVLSSMKTLNIKIDSDSGKILFDKVTTLFELGKVDKK